MSNGRRQVKPTRADLRAVRRVLHEEGLDLGRGTRVLAQLVADAREHGYSGHTEAGYNTCRCSECLKGDTR